MYRPPRRIDASSPGGRIDPEAHRPEGSRHPPTSFEGRMMAEDLLNAEQLNGEDANTGEMLVQYMIWLIVAYLSIC